MKNVGLVTSVGCALPPVTANRLSGFAELNLKSAGVDPDFPGLIVVNFPEIPGPRVLPKKSPFCVIAFISDGGRGSPEKNTPLFSMALSFCPWHGEAKRRRLEKMNQTSFRWPPMTARCLFSCVRNVCKSSGSSLASCGESRDPEATHSQTPVGCKCTIPRSYS